MFYGRYLSAGLAPDPDLCRPLVWAPVAPKHNLASICERYGGGGHARVGAISLEPGALEKARSVAAEIVAELKT